jgi:hypothetical protein
MSNFQLVQQAVAQSSNSLLDKLASIEKIEQALQQELLEEENK